MSRISNKKVSFDYEILEKIEAGMILNGVEVKALRAGKVSMKGSYVVVMQQVPYVIGMQISLPGELSARHKIPLLLKVKEIEKLEKLEKTTGLTVVPTKIYNTRGLFKIEIAIAKGKKNYDKRASLKHKSQSQDIARSLKNFNR